MPPGPQAGSPQACPETKSILSFDIVEGFRRVIDGSLSFVFSSSHLTSFTVAFSATLTTPAIVPAQLAVVWSLPLRGRLRGAYPHRQHGITSGRSYLHRINPRCSWRNFCRPTASPGLQRLAVRRL